MQLHHGDGHWRVTAGQLVLFRQGDDSRYGKIHPQDAYACRWVTLGGAGLDAHMQTLVDWHGPVFDTGEQHPLIDQMGQLQSFVGPHRGPVTTVAHAVHTFVMMLFEFAQRRLDRRLSPAERGVQRLLRDPYTNEGLKTIAGEVGCTRETLSRAFKAETGEPPHTYATRLRSQRALNLLRATVLPMDEIARQAGFTNAHTLARQVRSLTGLSPTQFRKQAQTPTETPG